MKLCLGTVQFGMNYGIQRAGQPSLSDALDIIDTAVQRGVSAIDTAAAYGTAEEVVGTYLSQHPGNREHIELISKLPPNISNEVNTSRDVLMQSLERLKTDYLDCFLLHSPAHMYNNSIVESLFKLKSEGLVRQVGVSVYTPDEAKQGISLGFDAMQIPYSVFDQRMAEQGVLELAHQNGVSLYVRSVFTQGLALMDEVDIPQHLERARPIVKNFSAFCNEHSISRLQLALLFVYRQASVSSLVFGVDNKRQLIEIIDACKQTAPADILEKAAQQFAGLDEDIVVPAHWKS